MHLSLMMLRQKTPIVKSDFAENKLTVFIARTLVRSKNAWSSKMFFLELPDPFLWHSCWSVSSVSRSLSGFFPFPRSLLFFTLAFSTLAQRAKTNKRTRAMTILCQDAIL